MVVYIDILIVINTVINYAVLMTADKLLKRNIRLYRLIIGAFTGALFSLIIFTDIDNQPLLWLIRLISSAVIALAAFGYKSRREYIKALIMTAAVSLVYCGGFILFYQLFKPPNMLIINDVPYFEVDPLLMIILTAVIYIILLVISKLFSERIKSTVVPVKFSINKKDYSCIGKVDTGCNLTEPFSNSPVIIVDRSIITINDNEPRRIIPYTSIGGSSYLSAVKADSVTIDNKCIDKIIYIAMSDINNGQYEAIINSDILR